MLIGKKSNSPGHLRKESSSYQKGLAQSHTHHFLHKAKPINKNVGSYKQIKNIFKKMLEKPADKSCSREISNAGGAGEGIKSHSVNFVVLELHII